LSPAHLAKILFLAAALLAGCAGPTFVVQQYAGPVRPKDTIATLRVNGADSVRVMTLDEEDIAAPIVQDGRLHIELLPGRHAITVSNASAPQEPPKPIAFQAEPGKVYRVAFTPDARIFEVDRGADTVGRDATSP
jgi:hypothetical protein